MLTFFTKPGNTNIVLAQSPSFNGKNVVALERQDLESGDAALKCLGKVESGKCVSAG